MEYLKLFETNSARTEYEGGGSYVEPYVSYVKEDTSVHYNAVFETRLIAYVYVFDTSSPTKILNTTNAVSEIEIDGVVQPSVTSGYTFSTTGQHVVKYTLVDQTTIPTKMLYEVETDDIIIPRGVTTLATSAFTYARFNNLSTPNTLRTIGYAAFKYSTIESIILNEGLQTIGKEAFWGVYLSYSSLNVVIPSTVYSIGLDAFIDSSAFNSITFLSTTPPHIDNSFESTTPLYVPSGSVNTYKAAWPSYASNIQAIPTT